MVAQHLLATGVGDPDAAVSANRDVVALERRHRDRAHHASRIDSMNTAPVRRAKVKDLIGSHRSARVCKIR